MQLGDDLFPAAGWGCQGRRTKRWRGKEDQSVPGLLRSGDVAALGSPTRVPQALKHVAEERLQG